MEPNIDVFPEEPSDLVKVNEQSKDSSSERVEVDSNIGDLATLFNYILATRLLSFQRLKGIITERQTSSIES